MRNTELFSPVKVRRAFEAVCDSIRAQVAGGQLKPGDRLPPDRLLASQLGVSRMAVREALRSLEKELDRPRTPIIALTAHAFEEHQQRSLAAGCDDFQIKPIPKTRLLGILSTWMAVRPH